MQALVLYHTTRSYSVGLATWCKGVCVGVGCHRASTTHSWRSGTELAIASYSSQTSHKHNDARIGGTSQFWHERGVAPLPFNLVSCALSIHSSHIHLQIHQLFHLYHTNHTQPSQWPLSPVSRYRVSFPAAVRTFLSSFELCVCAVQGKIDKHHTSVTDSSLLQTSLPLSLRPSLSALPSTTSPPSPSSAPSSVTPTVRPRLPTPRRSSSSPRRLPRLPLPGVLPLPALPSSPTVLVLSSTPLALSLTRVLPTSVA